MDERLAECRSCRAQIVWRQPMKKDGMLGKMAPFNWPLEPCKSCDGAGVIVIHGSLPDYERCAACRGSGRTFISHFATCPAAPSFRKKG